jgi:23S rRNA pseudouridine1911/1915/1917 synthase
MVQEQVRPVVPVAEGSPDSGASEFRESQVPETDGGERLDSWLARHHTDHSRSELRRCIEDGRVTIDGVAAKKASRKLNGGEKIRFTPPPPPQITPLPEDVPLEILHQDEHLLVISKEAGMIVHPSPGAPPEGTLVNALLGHSRGIADVGEEDRPGIVHRLDRETSGVMVIARTNAAHRELSRQFHDREVSKEYLALCHGQPENPSGEIDLPLARSFTDTKKWTVRHDADARNAFTAWKLKKTFPDLRQPISWIHCFPRTGRTHQIRVHLRALGHPILCDYLYGREKRLDLAKLGRQQPEAVLERHALHAWKLHLKHPASGQSMLFEAPLPADLVPWWTAGTLWQS